MGPENFWAHWHDNLDVCQCVLKLQGTTRHCHGVFLKLLLTQDIAFFFTNGHTGYPVYDLKAFCGTMWRNACKTMSCWHAVGNNVGWPSDVCEWCPEVLCGHLSDGNVFQKFLGAISLMTKFLRSFWDPSKNKVFWLFFEFFDSPKHHFWWIGINVPSLIPSKAFCAEKYKIHSISFDLLQSMKSGSGKWYDLLNLRLHVIRIVIPAKGIVRSTFATLRKTNAPIVFYSVPECERGVRYAKVVLFEWFG